MPSLALPPVAAAMPVPASVNMTAQDAAGIDGAQQASGSGDGTSSFAAMLDRQMAVTGEGAKRGLGPEGLTVSTDEATGDSSAQPVSDLAALLQGLLLPLTPVPAAKTAPALDRPEGSPADSTQSAALLAMPSAMSAGNEVEPEALGWIGTHACAASDIAEDRAGSIETTAILGAETGKAAPAESAALPVPPGGSLEMQHLVHVPQHGREPVDSAHEQMIVRTPVTSPNWHEDLGAKVSMLIGKELSSAELVLTPPSLGRVEVQLSVNGDHTSAVFVAATPAARDALEQALPKLRDFLADAGINLSQATVGGESSREGGRQGGQPNRHAGGGDVAVSASDGAAVSAVLRRADGMVDTFA